MADRKISELTNITGANLADDDEFALVDTSADETKAITFGEFKTALDTATGFVRITGDTMTGNLSMGDNVKAIFGAGSDLQIFSEGSGGNSFINETGNGSLYINASNLYLRKGEAAFENFIACTANGDVKLYYDNAEKLATESGGVNITGTLTSDGLTVDGDANLSGTAVNFDLDETDTTDLNTRFRQSAGQLFVQTANDAKSLGYNRLNINHTTGDISFYDDQGSSQSFFWDASVESLGIGTSSPDLTLDVSHNVSSEYVATFQNTADNLELKIGTTSGLLNIQGANASNNAAYQIALNAEGGNVGIGTSSPSSTLTVETGGIASLSSYAGHIVVGPSSRTSSSGDYSGGILFDQANGVQASGKKGASIVGFQDGSDVNSMGLTFNVHGTDGSANREEAMRLTSAGDLLVGKTTIATGTAGIALRSNGEVRGTADGDYAARFSRLTSDGAIVGFEKDGTVVGSIGTYSGYISVGSGDVYLLYNSSTNSLLPASTVTAGTSDGAIDLGSSSRRFKDLYLSGSIEIENGSGNVGVGKQALNSNTGSDNTAFGKKSLYSNTSGSKNLALGKSAGFNNTEGTSNTFVGAPNSSTGYGAGYFMTTGSKNTILGAYNGNQGGLDIRTSSNNIVLSDGDGNHRMHTDSSGRTFFGPEDTTHAVLNTHSTGSLMAMNIYQIGNVDRVACKIRNDYAQSSQSATMIQFCSSNGTERGTIKTTGSSTSYNTSSDHRLKENVVELTGATTRLKQLEPKRFNFIADADTTVDGFLAHEVQSVVPEAITGTHNEVDDDGNPVYQGIDQSKLVPLLVATIKELEARITALENA